MLVRSRRGRPAGKRDNLSPNMLSHSSSKRTFLQLPYLSFEINFNIEVREYSEVFRPAPIIAWHVLIEWRKVRSIRNKLVHIDTATKH
jgi:hypothetical protein